MSKLIDKELFIKSDTHRGNKELETIGLENALFVGGGAFKDCTSLTDVYFGYDISRISHGAFENCTSLKDVWFAIIDEDKIIEIADDAFRGCNRDIAFHIFVTAKNNKYLNRYANKHGFRVEGMF